MLNNIYVRIIYQYTILLYIHKIFVHNFKCPLSKIMFYTLMIYSDLKNVKNIYYNLNDQ